MLLFYIHLWTWDKEDLGQNDSSFFTNKEIIGLIKVSEMQFFFND